MKEQMKGKKRYNPYRAGNYNSTKLLVPRNGPNVKERIDIENKLNL